MPDNFLYMHHRKEQESQYQSPNPSLSKGRHYVSPIQYFIKRVDNLSRIRSEKTYLCVWTYSIWKFKREVFRKERRKIKGTIVSNLKWGSLFWYYNYNYNGKLKRCIKWVFWRILEGLENSLIHAYILCMSNSFQ